MMLIAYAHALVTGWAARLWRLLRNGDCPCEPCRGHRQFVRDTDVMYRAAVLRDPHPYTDDQGDIYRSDLPTLDEARGRRPA